MSSQVYYDNSNEAVVVTPVAFLNASGSTADPSSISCIVTDPTGNATTYTYGGSPPDNLVTRVSSGNYALTLTGLTIPGLYTFVWVGTGNSVNQITPGTFRTVPITDTGIGMTTWYCGKEELKSWLNISPSDTASDYEIQTSIQTVSNWINLYCGRHFYQISETRTFVPSSVWGCDIDDLVSTPAIVANTQVNLDYNGNGVYSVAWTQGTEYQLLLGPQGNWGDNYNINAAGVQRPFRHIQVLTGISGEANVPGGGWFPWLWPYTYLNRVQVVGTWGWNTIPPNVTRAALLLAVDMFKSKDAAWGIAGDATTGLMRVQSNPWVVELLKDYINVKRKVGM